MNIEKGLKCPFSLEEMQDYYNNSPLTHETYFNMRYDYDRLVNHNRSHGIQFVPEEMKIAVYLGDVYKAIHYGGST